jgi:hypothetical protein
MSFGYTRIEEGEVKSPYDDSRMRAVGIEFFEKAKGLKFRDGTEQGIDLILISNPDVGAEGENAKWHGDRWVDRQANLFKQKFNTLNIQDRKWHYWNLQELSDKPKAKLWWGKHDPGWEENYYFRMNSEEDQICVVDGPTIHDSEKRVFVPNEKVGNSWKPEDWICVKQEFVETWNKQPNGIWELDGTYHGPNKSECDAIWIEEKRLKKEREKKRAVETYKNRKRK